MLAVARNSLMRVLCRAGHPLPLLRSSFSLSLLLSSLLSFSHLIQLSIPLSSSLPSLRAASCTQRVVAAKPWTMELIPPPQPVPRRKRPFIVPNIVKKSPPPREVVIVLDGFVMLEACRVEDPEDAEKAVLEGCESVRGSELCSFSNDARTRRLPRYLISHLLQVWDFVRYNRGPRILPQALAP